MFFVTNTASKTPIDCVNKMKSMGYTGAKESQIYAMADVLAKYLKKKFPEVRKVFAIGLKSMRDSLEAQGVEVLGADQPVIPEEIELSAEEFESLELDHDVGAVVYGADFYFNYNKILLASLYLNELKVPLIVTNDDSSALIRNRLMPGAGAGLAAILAMTKLERGSHVGSSLLNEPGTF